MRLYCLAPFRERDRERDGRKGEKVRVSEPSGHRLPLGTGGTILGLALSSRHISQHLPRDPDNSSTATETTAYNSSKLLGCISQHLSMLKLSISAILQPCGYWLSSGIHNGTGIKERMPRYDPLLIPHASHDLKSAITACCLSKCRDPSLTGIISL